jgi:hypothetical protein
MFRSQIKVFGQIKQGLIGRNEINLIEFKFDRTNFAVVQINSSRLKTNSFVFPQSMEESRPSGS